jgi:hypothetical protein
LPYGLGVQLVGGWRPGWVGEFARHFDVAAEWQPGHLVEGAPTGETKHSWAKAQAENVCSNATHAGGNEVPRLMDENDQADSEDDLEYA